jgi:hypothetical protein
MPNELMESAKLFSTLDRGLCPIVNKKAYEGFGKKPLYDDWQQNPMLFEEIKPYIDKGHNVGWVLGKDDLVIDVDPRNGGTEGLEKFCKALGTTSDALHFLYPTVHTGGDGLHFYMKKRTDTRTTYQLYEDEREYEYVDCVDYCKEFGKGLEFKAYGSMMIIPGSIHKTGKLYRWFQGSPYQKQAPKITDGIHNLMNKHF